MVANNAFMIEEMKQKVRKETEKDARKQEKIEIVKNLLDTLDDETISLKVGFSVHL